jgi:hypothetical protein
MDVFVTEQAVAAFDELVPVSRDQPNAYFDLGLKQAYAKRAKARAVDPQRDVQDASQPRREWHNALRSLVKGEGIENCVLDSGLNEWWARESHFVHVSFVIRMISISGFPSLMRIEKGGVLANDLHFSMQACNCSRHSVATMPAMIWKI